MTLLMRTISHLFILILLGASFASAQPSSARLITVDTRLSSDRVTAGGAMRVAIIMTVSDGWHINSHQPTYDYLIGTSLELTPQEGVIVTDIRYPKGVKVKLGFADDALDVYEKSVTLFATLKFSGHLPAGVETLRGSVTFQACNDQVCQAPSTIALVVPITVAAAQETVQPANADLFAAYKPEELVGGGGRNELAATFEERGSLTFFVAIFLIGLALNLTPCVYPMLSVTVSLFGGQSETNVLRVFFKAVVYVLGIATMYSVLGVTAALGGGLFGSWLQSPWVLGGIGALLFAMALSSFGLYQIQMPYWITSRLGGTTGTGIIAVYLSGLVVGVFAAPCVGPPVIALLTFVGTKGDPVFGFWSFFLLSLGLGFPYLILGTFSGLLKKIPRSGTWLIWVEHVFGVILTAAALFYLSLAAAPKLTMYVVPLSLVIGGIFLGFIDPSGRDKRLLRRIQLVFGIASIAFGAWMALGLREPGVQWEKYSEGIVTEARENGVPVVMDFYADWCIPCLELDRNTWTDAGVVKATKDVARIKVDLTHFDSPESEALRKRYNISGVPTVIFLKGDGTEMYESRIVGFMPPKDVLARLKPVLHAP
jgi:thiol:disulfide interchange protein DsbD